MEPKSTNTLHFFLDCNDCDFTFVRQELPFASFVRDPQLADVHILVTDSNTGGGGNKYFLNFIGMKDFSELNYDYTVTTKQSDTDDDVRKNLLKIIKVGILPYYSRSGFIDDLSIDLEQSDFEKANDLIIDPWNKWIFRIGAETDFQLEKSQNEYSFETNTRISKITEDWKISINASYELNRENYFDDDVKITNKQDNKDLSIDYIKSLSDKWSAGLFGDYLSRTYLNIKNSYSAKAGVEYNFFPWDESNRRRFVLRYSTGISSYYYNGITIYDKIQETRMDESMQLYLELIQPWGEIFIGIKGSHYFHDFSKNRLSFDSNLSLRLTRNLSVNFRLDSRAIHNQLYLPVGDASVEDLLLKRRKLATEYEFSGRVGFQFTFGSIYNNVVNERF